LAINTRLSGHALEIAGPAVKLVIGEVHTSAIADVFTRIAAAHTLPVITNASARTRVATGTTVVRGVQRHTFSGVVAVGGSCRTFTLTCDTFGARVTRVSASATVVRMIVQVHTGRTLRRVANISCAGTLPLRAKGAGGTGIPTCPAVIRVAVEICTDFSTVGLVGVAKRGDPVPNASGHLFVVLQNSWETRILFVGVLHPGPADLTSYHVLVDRGGLRQAGEDCRQDAAKDTAKNHLSVE